MSQLKTMQDDHFGHLLAVIGREQRATFCADCRCVAGGAEDGLHVSLECRRTGTPHRLRVQPLAPASQSRHGFAIEQAFKPVVSAVFLPA